MAATRALVRGRSRLTRQSVEELMAELATREYPAHAPVPKGMRERYAVIEDEVDGAVVLTLTPHGRATGQQVIYTHGGSYVHPLVAEHWWLLARMIGGTGVTLTVPLYRLAPESGVDAAYVMLRRVYADVAGRGPVTLAGDSSGGGLALGQAVAHRDAGLPPARQVILIGPWVDIAGRHPAMAALQGEDPSLRLDNLRACGALWSRGHDDRDPLVSPLFADLAGLPPVHTFQGGHDLLAPDAHALASLLEQAGNAGSFTFAPAGFHGYLAAYWTPEARRGLRSINRLLRE